MYILFRIVEDGEYGSFDENSGKWNGMIGNNFSNQLLYFHKSKAILTVQGPKPKNSLFICLILFRQLGKA